MKIVHIESGLGNQMLSYCEYLAMKKMNPNDQVFIENIIYDIPECSEEICQWNGYELKRIFNINAPNVKSIFSEEQWSSIMREIRESEFWIRKIHNWNWPVYFTKAFNHAGLALINARGDFEEPTFMKTILESEEKNIKNRIKSSTLYEYLRSWKYRHVSEDSLVNYEKDLFYESTENILTGQLLDFKFKKSGIERIEKEIRDSFKFPAISDARNVDLSNELEAKNSVAIHARRGDMLGVNHGCYVSGYFRRAVSYIRSQVSSPEFYIFCDPQSVSWAKENEKVLGLNFKRDKIHFVDWNKGENSYIDMQLMAKCKHQVITNSSFGWWGAWLNEYPGKITCAPDYNINTTHTF